MVSGIAIVIWLILGMPSVQDPFVTHITGVYKGKTLFIQNTYDPDKKTFCVAEISVNNHPIRFNPRSSAIKLDFENVDLHAPVTISIVHADSLCKPIIINPDAIFYHSIFSFKELVLNDTVLVWRTVGDKAGALYIIENYETGIWREVDTVVSRGKFEGAEYSYFPNLLEGANKYRIRYAYPDGTYLYSWELDLHYYPEPVTFKPATAADFLYLSRVASYNIYDAGSELVLSGQGITIDVSSLPEGEYVVYFDGKDPGVFKKR